MTYPHTLLKALSITFLLTLTSGVHASEDVITNASWTIEVDSSCNSFTIPLTVPALDVSCDLDSTTGNPSAWFNPLATCNLSFDMIGLPSMGDIIGGIAGQVCDAIKEVKEKTIDKVIDDINEQIPDDLFDDIKINVDLNDKTEGGNSGGNSGGNTTDPDLCFIDDGLGKKVSIPCNVVASTGEPNKCYRRNDLQSSFYAIACNRPTPEKEICVIRYEEVREEGIYKKVPIFGLCGGQPAVIGAACVVGGYENNGIGLCSAIGREPSQSDRACSIESENSNSFIASCDNVEAVCYGHMNGVFHADTCRTFAAFNSQYNGNEPTESDSDNTSDPYENFEW